MEIAITGYSGYLGKLITKEFATRGHIIKPIRRHLLYGAIDSLESEISGTDAIIHLSGSSILTRWNKKNKQKIEDSRITTTKNLFKAIENLSPENRPKKFIQTSAIGIYNAFEIHDEKSQNFGDDFVANVVQQWEKASKDLPAGIERVVFRIGLVIGRQAKTITNLRLPFLFGLGATIGSGKQPFPFIHDSDVAAAFLWATENSSAKGIYNLVAPQQISNSDFTRALAKALNRPAFFSIPVFVLKIVLGEAAVLLTNIPGVIPENLISEGFEFKYPNIESALKEIINT